MILQLLELYLILGFMQLSLFFIVNYCHKYVDRKDYYTFRVLMFELLVILFWPLFMYAYSFWFISPPEQKYQKNKTLTLGG